MFQKHTRYFVTSLTKDTCTFLLLKSTWVYFQTGYRKITPTAHRNTAFSQFRIRQWHDFLRFTLSVVNRSWTKVGSGHLISSIILYDNILWTDSIHLSLLSVHPKVSSKTKNIKAASIRNSYMTVKWKWNCCTWMWKKIIQECLICLTRLTLFKALFNSQYTNHTNNYLYYRAH